MNNEIVEENKNNTNKILIAIIIILLLALGGLSYYTFFARDKEVDKQNPVVDTTKKEESTNPVVEPTKKSEIDNNKFFNSFPYDQLITNFQENGKVISDELKVYITYLLMDKKTSDLSDINLNDEEKSDAKYKIDYSKISNGKTTGIYGGGLPSAFNGYTFKNKMISLFGSDNNIFNKSFYMSKIGFVCGGILNAIYDNDVDKIILGQNGGCIIGNNVLSTVINIESNENLYKVSIVSGYFFSNKKEYKLLDKISGNTVIDKFEYNYETVDEVLKENQNRLTKYEFNFELINGEYRYLNMKEENQNNELKLTNEKIISINGKIKTLYYQLLYDSYEKNGNLLNTTAEKMTFLKNIMYVQNKTSKQIMVSSNENDIYEPCSKGTGSISIKIDDFKNEYEKLYGVNYNSNDLNKTFTVIDNYICTDYPTGWNGPQPTLKFKSKEYNKTSKTYIVELILLSGKDGQNFEIEKYIDSSVLNWPSDLENGVLTIEYKEDNNNYELVNMEYKVY